VWEWCEDRYAFDYYKTCANGEVDPLGPDPIETFPCVMRGGYWFSGTGGCRASSRTSGAVANRGSSIGFRVARNP
jgi:formylglycine-generating enzyme required for sulfatase activity